MKLSENQCAVLRAVRRKGEMTRAELFREIGLTNGAISRIAKELLLLGFLEEGEKLSGRRGQPARPLRLSPGGGISFGLSFGLRSAEFVALDYSGKVLKLDTVPIDEPDPRVIASIGERFIRKFLAGREFGAARILGLGVAVPGIFLGENALATSDWFGNWRNPDVRKLFAGHVDGPIWFENTGTAAAMAEHIAGSASRADVSFVVYLSHGIGGGLIIDGRPFRGASGNACEISTVFPVGAGPRPSVRDLLEEIEVEVGIDNREAMLRNMWTAGDNALLNWAQRAGNQLLELCSRITYFYDPGVIVLAGRLPWEMLDHMARNISADMERTVLPSYEPEILASRLGSSVAAIGAASLPTMQTAGTQFLGKDPKQG